MADARGNPWIVILTLCGREWTRFLRQRNRVIGAIGQPIFFWALFGAGLGPTFRLPGDADGVIGYREYFFPGTLALIILFTAIFTTISLIEDRREGFLQSVLVAPIPRWSMVAGKVLGGATLAWVQGMLFMLLIPTLGVAISPIRVLAVAALALTMAWALVSLGFSIAWRMDSTQGFHAVMSLFLLPMWLLSGAFFPANSGILAWIVKLNPLSYGVAGLRRLFMSAAEGAPAEALLAELPTLATCWLVTGGFAVVCFALAWRLAGSRVTGDLL